MAVEGLPLALALVAAYGYVAFFLVLFVEELGVPLPLPGDLTLLFAGYLVGRGVLRFDLTIMTVVLAAMSGASALYFLSRRYGRPAVLRYGGYIHLDAGRLGWLEERYRRFGLAAILLARATPGMRIYTSILAALGGVSYPRFATGLALASVIWAAGFVFLGSQVGERWDDLAALLEHHAVRVAAALILLGVLGALCWWWRRRAGRPANPQRTLR